MPSLVIAPSSTAPSLVSPPLTVFQPPPRILKRPSASTSSSAAELQTHESFLDREAKYQAARERIFGAESREGKDVLRNQRSDTLVPVTNIVRDPHGPDEDSRGFGGRRVHRVLSNSLPRAESEL
jgi:hypothetical protein